MKQKDFKEFNDDILYLIRQNLLKQNYKDLPIKVLKYINTPNPHIGSITTRAMRCVSLIDHEIVNRFLLKHEKELSH